MDQAPKFVTIQGTTMLIWWVEHYVVCAWIVECVIIMIVISRIWVCVRFLGSLAAL